MQVFKAFYRIVKKNIPSLMIYLVIFLAISLLFTGNGQATDKEMFNDVVLNVAVLNRDKSELGTAVESFIADTYQLAKIEDENEVIQDELFFRTVDYVLIIPEGFEKDFLSDHPVSLENIKIPGSATGYYVDSQVEKYLKMMKIYLSSGYTIKESVGHVEEDLKHTTEVSFAEEEDKIEMPALFYYFRYLPYIFIALLISGLGPILIVFNKTEIRRRNMCSAMHIRSQNNQIVLGIATFSLGCWFLFIIWAVIFFRNGFFTVNVALALLNTIVFLLVALSIAFVTGSAAKSSAALNVVPNAVGLGLCFLGGIFVPQDIMGENILVVARFVPTYWYTKVNDTLSTLLNFDWEHMKDIYLGMGIQLGFAAAIFTIGLVVRKNRQLAD